MNQKVKRITSLKVGAFVERHAESLKMVSLNGELGYDKDIYEPSVNRPGLALSGFVDYFACERVQVFGNSEFSYLEKTPLDERKTKFQDIIDIGFPCAVIARGGSVPQDIINVASKNDIAVFSTPLSTMEYMNKAMFLLELEFAATTNLHGCMISYRGVGMLIMGSSGSGKSEAALGLVEKGAAIIADDKVKIKKANGQLTATTEAFSRGFMEMRGIGIINVGSIYGQGAVRDACDLDLIVFLKPEADLNKVDRVGVKREEYDVLGVGVPYLEIPVAPGRDTARLISVAAADFQLRKMGYDMAAEFNQRIINQMQ